MEEFPKQFLQQDETLLWVNKPHITLSWLARTLVKSQKFLIGILSILLILTVISPFRANGLVLFVVCLLPILIVFQLWIIFRFVRTFNSIAYAITNQRVIQFLPNRDAIHAFMDIEELESFDRSDEFDGFATFRFPNQFTFMRVSDGDVAEGYIKQYGSRLSVDSADNEE